MSYLILKSFLNLHNILKYYVKQKLLDMLSSCKLEQESKIDYVDQEINYVDIKYYEESRKILKKSLDSFMIVLKEREYEHDKQTHQTSILEILTDYKVRMYFDIENIPRDNQEMIYEIINEIYKMTGLDKYDPKHEKYALTFNPNSHHEGLSYHLYLPIRTTKRDIYNFIKLFNHYTDYKYVNMIDYRVYGKNRLFRTVGCCCPGQWKKRQQRRLDDYHRLVKGDLDDTVIQNYKNLSLVFSCSCDQKINDEFDKKVYKTESNFSESQARKYQYYKKPNPFNKSYTFNNNESLIERINEMKNKIDMKIFKNANKTKQIINNQNQLRDTNRMIFLMFVAVIVLMIANLFK